MFQNYTVIEWNTPLLGADWSPNRPRFGLGRVDLQGLKELPPMDVRVHVERLSLKQAHEARGPLRERGSEGRKG